jgi:hypothetical protein
VLQQTEERSEDYFLYTPAKNKKWVNLEQDTDNVDVVKV